MHRRRAAVLACVLWVLGAPLSAANRVHVPGLKGPVIQPQSAMALRQLPASLTDLRPGTWTLSVEPGVTLRTVLAAPGAIRLLEAASVEAAEPAAPPRIEFVGVDGRPLRKSAAVVPAFTLPPARQALKRLEERGLSAGAGENMAASLPAVFEGSARAPRPAVDLSADGRSVESWLNPRFLRDGEAAAAAVRRLRSTVAKVLPLLRRSVGARVRAGARLTLDDACCGLAAPDLGYLLRRAGHPVHAVEAEFHVYLAQPYEGELLIVDPTVRQFFGGPAAPQGVPAVFVGTLGELHALFARYDAYRTNRWSVQRIYLDEGVVRDERLREVQLAVEE